jgi:putative toxin-antitoxin system antitoxin component (TIGR02293 family)
MAAAVIASQIAEVLGGRQSLHGTVRSLDELEARIQRGLPYEAVEAVSKRYSIDLGELREILRIAERTFTRRRKAARLHAVESDRLVRVARIVALAVDVLGTRERASEWLQRPNRALGNAAPLRSLQTELGARRVEDILGRIAYGLHS